MVSGQDVLFGKDNIRHSSRHYKYFQPEVYLLVRNQTSPCLVEIHVCTFTFLFDGIICESIGVLYGIILSYDLVSATLVTMASSFPILMFAGFLIKVADIPWYFSSMTYISYARYSFEGILTSVYGFGRCQDYGISSDDFMKELQEAQNPVEFISTLWSNFNITHYDAKLYAPVIGVPTSHLESVINGTSSFLGLNNDNMTSDLPDIVPAHDTEPSYVMSYFKLTDDHLANSFFCLITIAIILKIAIFCLLSYKTKRKR